MRRLGPQTNLLAFNLRASTEATVIIDEKRGAWGQWTSVDKGRQKNIQTWLKFCFASDARDL